MKKRPEIGSAMWDVLENLYYDKSKSVAPLKEFVVSEGKVRGFLTISYTSMFLVGPVGERASVVREYRLADIGKRVFFTAGEAAFYAKKLSDKYDQTWERISKGCPIRRTWEKYLCEVEGEKKK